jgi:creatinine amidohydrolase
VLPVWRTPPRPFGAAFAGTLSLSPGGVTALLLDLARELTRHGFAALAIANAHLDPSHLGALDELVAYARSESLLPVVWPNLTRKPWGSRLGDEFMTGACHAGRFESSIVMAARPELVRDELRQRARAESPHRCPRRSARAGARSRRPADRARTSVGRPKRPPRRARG